MPGNKSSRGSGTAPDFVLRSLDGKDVALSGYRGKIVVLEFWATWCPPCRATIPDLIAIQNKYGNRGLIVLGVVLDDEQGLSGKLLDFTKKFKINYPILLGNESISNAYNVSGIPRSFLIDKDGRVVESYLGYIENFTDVLSKKVDEII